MRLGKTVQISVQSSPEIMEMMLELADDLDAMGVEFLAKKPTRQALVNALIFWAASLPAKEKGRLFRQAFFDLENRVLGREKQP